jgi:branched-chain amino acid transport system ATP-binding protein
MSLPVLEVSGLCAGYGQMEVVSEVSLVLTAGELVSMLGRNGAGKSTTLHAIAGVRTGWHKGDVTVEGRTLNRLSPAKVAASGVALVPEGRRIFREMTVRENLQVGAYLRRRRPKEETNEDLERAFALFPALSQFAHKTTGTLSGGEQQMVAIGQAMMSRPRFLLLDEPTSGLSPSLSDQLYRALTTLAATGIGVLVVEQSVERALRHSERTYVMENGRVVLEGLSAQLGEGDVVNRIVMGVSAEGLPGVTVGRAGDAP